MGKHEALMTAIGEAVRQREAGSIEGYQKIFDSKVAPHLPTLRDSGESVDNDLYIGLMG
jgi:hypothetical protein